MTDRTQGGPDFTVDAGVLAAAFGLTEDEVRDRMRAGQITSRCEAGVGEDEGRWRLTFHHASRACRLTVDRQGTVLKQAKFPIRPTRTGGA